MNRRMFLTGCAGACGLLTAWRSAAIRAKTEDPDTPPPEEAYDWNEHEYAMLVDLQRCIGCGFCVQACKAENGIGHDAPHFRTWVERYILRRDESIRVDSPDGAINGFPSDVDEEEIFRSFFVPKLCNHCARPPCVQVCPVGATYRTRDGVVLVDSEYCMGCRYCIEACPYGARYLHPEQHVADKCTFCYHRVVRGLRPACVEACPQSVRVFGDLKDHGSELVKRLRRNPIQVLKPTLNTEPRAYYMNLDKEVR